MSNQTGESAIETKSGTVYAVLLALSLSHLLNDMLQSLIPAVYPVLKESYNLTFTQIGFITLAFQLAASLLQPLVGYMTDRHPRPFSLVAGMTMTLLGLSLLSIASTYPGILVSAAMVGIGSSIFHPESSRMARVASGGQHGLAQSVFQVGGNTGSALGPLLAALIVVPRGQQSIAWFTIAAFIGIIVLFNVGRWYRAQLARRAASGKPAVAEGSGLPRRMIATSVAVLLTLIFSKYFYMASISSYYTFYLMETFGISIQDSQIRLFVFLGSVAVGTLAGGPIGDRIGFKAVIWGSILGVLPFTLVLPHANLFWTTALTVPIGLILASAFSAIMVYAQSLLPNRVGMVAGLFFGFAFGMAGLAAAILGRLADLTSIQFVYRVCAYLPLLGLLAAFLPDLRTARSR